MHSATDRQRRELCSKIRTVDADMHILQRRDERKACNLGNVSLGVREISQNAALTFPSNLRLIKFSCVTCKGEQSPSKFDTYSRQLKSTFGCQPDLNTLSARRRKSTIVAKRLTLQVP